MSSSSSYSPPYGIDVNWESKPDRSATAFDDTAYLFTDIFLDSVLKNDMLPQSVVDAFDLDDIQGFFQVKIL